MNKNKIYYFLDIIMFLLFIVVAISSVALYFLPSGVRRGSWQLFWGVSKSDWLFVHKWAGIVLIILMFIHFLLHWRWVLETTKNYFKKNK